MAKSQTRQDRIQVQEKDLVPASLPLFGTKSTAVDSAGMEEFSFRSLERICRAQAALTTHEPTKRQLERMAEEYRRQAEFQEHQQANE